MAAQKTLLKSQCRQTSGESLLRHVNDHPDTLAPHFDYFIDCFTDSPLRASSDMHSEGSF